MNKESTSKRITIAPLPQTHKPGRDRTAQLRCWGTDHTCFFGCDGKTVKKCLKENIYYR